MRLAPFATMLVVGAAGAETPNSVFLDTTDEWTDEALLAVAVKQPDRRSFGHRPERLLFACEDGAVSLFITGLLFRDVFEASVPPPNTVPVRIRMFGEGDPLAYEFDWWRDDGTITAASLGDIGARTALTVNCVLVPPYQRDTHQNRGG